jgi:hypothetical protein
MAAEQPTSLPRWATDGGATLEPSSGQKDTGWEVDKKPPARFMNWLFNLIYDWTQYLQSPKGTGAGAGVDALGGDTDGPGLKGTGGGTGGVGVEGVGASASGAGVKGTGTAAAATGVDGTGGSTGAGVTGTGGSTSGPGVSGTATAGNSPGNVGQGVGSGAGIEGTGGDTGPGVNGIGGASGGNGVEGTGTAGGTRGVKGTGNTTGHGVEGFGGGSGGSGGSFQGGGGTDGHGVIANVTAVNGGYAVRADGKATSPRRSSLLIGPQDTLASVPEKGAVEVLSGDGKVYSYNGTSWDVHFAGQSYAGTSNESKSGDVIGTTLTDFTDKYTIPANTLKVGSTIRVRAAFRVQSASGAATVKFQVVGKDGATIDFFFATSTNPTAVTGHRCVVEGFGTVKTVGGAATGEILSSGTAILSLSAQDGDSAASSALYGTTFDTGAAVDIKAQVQFGGSPTASDVVFLEQLIVDVL